MMEFLIQVASTVAGGILLAIIFFFVKEKFFHLPVLSGLWTFIAITEKTAYNPYNDMSLSYLVLLVQEGNRLAGTGEKTRERTKIGAKEYNGKDRTQIQITGYITQRFFSPDECIIHIMEAGKVRKSSAIHTLKVLNTKSLDGSFVSTIANQTGRVCWNKGNDNYSFYDKS